MLFRHYYRQKNPKCDKRCYYEKLCELRSARSKFPALCSDIPTGSEQQHHRRRSHSRKRVESKLLKNSVGSTGTESIRRLWNACQLKRSSPTAPASNSPDLEWIWNSAKLRNSKCYSCIVASCQLNYVSTHSRLRV